MDPYGPSTVPAGAVVSRGPVARWLWELEARSPVAPTSSRAAMAARRPRCSRARAAVSGTQGMAPICSVTATLSVSYSSVSRVFPPARTTAWWKSASAAAAVAGSAADSASSRRRSGWTKSSPRRGALLQQRAQFQHVAAVGAGGAPHQH
nr:hypothetical protein [Nocardia brasiliensis]